MGSKLTSSWLRDLLFLAIGLAIIYSIFLGYRPLSVPDEARYAEIPREMVATGNYITPHLNYVKYFEKPVLFYWLQAGAIKALGDTELAVRIPNLLMALLGCLLTYATGRLLYNPKIGIWASLILASASLYFVMGHLVTLDMTLSTLITASLFCFLLGTKTSQPSHTRWAYYGFYIFCALGFLTKGLVALIFPAMIIGSWIILTNQWQIFKKFLSPIGIIIFIIIAAPWHILVQIHNPEFFRFYFLDQQFLRYFTNAANRSQPFGFFLAVLLLGFLPWSAFIIQAYYYSLRDIYKNYTQNKFNLFLLLWPSLIFLFFFFSHSQLIPYILPVFSPLAILIARYLINNLETSGIRWGYTSIALIIFAAAVGALIVNQSHKLLVLTAITHELWAISIVWIASSILATWAIWHKRSALAFCAMLFGSFLVYFVILIAMPKADTRSIKPLVQVIKPVLKPNDSVVTYENYYQDLPFYLQRRITIVDWQNELSFGMQHQDTTEWMIQPGPFWQLWQSPRKIYMLTDKDTYATLLKANSYKLYLLAETPGDVLLTNHI